MHPPRCCRPKAGNIVGGAYRKILLTTNDRERIIVKLMSFRIPIPTILLEFLSRIKKLLFSSEEIVTSVKCGNIPPRSSCFC